MNLKYLDLGALTMAVFPPSFASEAVYLDEFYHPSEQGVTLHVKTNNIENALQLGQLMLNFHFQSCRNNL